MKFTLILVKEQEHLLRNLIKAFKTEDSTAIAEKIMQKGDLNLTTDQRRKMIEEKRKQIVEYIAKTFVDPSSHLPHPPLRIEQAMKDGRVSVDPQKNVEEQVKDIVEKLRSYHSTQIRKSRFRNYCTCSICCTIIFCFEISRFFEKRRMAIKWFSQSNT